MIFIKISDIFNKILLYFGRVSLLVCDWARSMLRFLFFFLFCKESDQQRQFASF